jgi:hypothetical protein
MSRKPYSRTEHAPLRGRAQPEVAGVRTVARVMAKAEASHAKGSKTTESARFRLEPNQAKHTTEGYGGTVTTDPAETIQQNSGF